MEAVINFAKGFVFVSLYPLKQLLLGLLKLPNTIALYCSGQGALWELLLVWYFLLNLFALCTGLLLFSLPLFLPDMLNPIASYLALGLLSLLGFNISCIYPIILAIALWQCAFNVYWHSLGYGVRLAILPFTVIHFIFLSG